MKEESFSLVYVYEVIQQRSDVILSDVCNAKIFNTREDVASLHCIILYETLASTITAILIHYEKTHILQHKNVN